VAVRWTSARRSVFLAEHGYWLARGRASCRAVSVWGTKGQTKLVWFRRRRHQRYESNQDGKGNLVIDSLPSWIEHRRQLSGKERRVLPRQGVSTFDALGAFPLPWDHVRAGPKNLLESAIQRRGLAPVPDSTTHHAIPRFQQSLDFYYTFPDTGQLTFSCPGDIGTGSHRIWEIGIVFPGHWVRTLRDSK